MVDKTNVRGYRNCNPLNIERGQNWKGLRQVQTDSRFCQFESMLFGLRAALVIIRNYIKGNNGTHRPLDTIEKIINRWAPPKENRTSAYVATVSKEVGYDMRLRVKWEDRALVCAIVKAMAKVETGITFDIKEVYSAYDLLS